MSWGRLGTLAACCLFVLFRFLPFGTPGERVSWFYELQRVGDNLGDEKERGPIDLLAGRQRLRGHRGVKTAKLLEQG